MLKGTSFLPVLSGGKRTNNSFRTKKSTLGEVVLSDNATLKVYKVIAEDGHAYLDLRVFANTRDYRGDTKSSIKVPLNKLKTLARELGMSVNKLKL